MSFCFQMHAHVQGQVYSVFLAQDTADDFDTWLTFATVGHQNVHTHTHTHTRTHAHTLVCLLSVSVSFRCVGHSMLLHTHQLFRFWDLDPRGFHNVSVCISQRTSMINKVNGW